MTLEEAEEVLKDYIDDNNLVWRENKCLQYLHYYRRNSHATLDGEFTADQLEAVAVWMRQHEI